jgi:hypothetical protein
MNKYELKELTRLFWAYEENPCKETGHELKYLLNYCAKNINLKKLKSKQLKFK